MMRLSLLRSRAYWVFCFFSPRITSQHLSLEMGRRSSIHTISPTANSFLSSCAWYFFERRTVFFMVGCVKRRSTRTTTVLSCLSLTTTPCSVRFGIAVSSLRLRLCRALLLRDGPNACNVATNLAHPGGVLELSRRPLEAQVEPLLLQLHALIVELVDGHGPQVSGFQHDDHPTHSAIRSTKRV